MDFQYVPLLQIQRELQGLPRDANRFRQYLRKLTADGATLDLPSLVLINPMGRDHVTTLLDALLAMDVDTLAVRTLADASTRLANVPGGFKVALVIADDLLGGWTNRYDFEFNHRFGPGTSPSGTLPRPRWLKECWLTGVLWSSEPASERAVQEALLTVIHRAAYVARHGHVRSLSDMLAQEGAVMRAAGCCSPLLDEEDIAYTREVLAPFLDAEDKRTCMECLFGDDAVRSLGFTPRGLSPWAGLALALHDARVNEPHLKVRK